MIKAERTPGFLHLLRMSGGAPWLHMCIRHRETESYLSSAAGLDNLISAAMVSEDTRSRLRVHGQGVMVLLKAMRLRADGVGHPEDMVSMRIWIDEGRVITTREEDVDPILELAEDISQGRARRRQATSFATSSKSSSRKFPSRSRCWRMGWI